MKKLFCCLFTIAFALGAFAQTPDEIVSRMETVVSQHEKEGVIMTVDVDIFLLGTMSSNTYTLGNKMRLDATMLGVTLTTWSDGTTEWTYNSKDNEIEIKDSKTKEKGNDSEGDLEMFSGITDGYDVSIDKETADAWYLYCKKSKSNTDKDAPKKMNLVVAKGTYMPISLKAKVSSASMTMRDISFGVTEEDVTFDPKMYPDAKIKDLREKH